MNFLSTTGLPAWVIPGVIVHLALFLTMIVPAWRGFAFARLGGPMSLVLAIPLAGLVIAAVLMTGALRRAGWPVFGVVLLFVPVINVLYMWMFGFGRWTSERSAIRKRTEEAAAMAANEDAIAPSRRVQDKDAGELPPEAGPDGETTADDAETADAAAREITEEPPDRTDTEATEAPHAASVRPAPDAPRAAPPAGDMTFIAGAGGRTAATDGDAPETAEPAPEPPKAPAAGEDMTFIAGRGSATPETDGKSPETAPAPPEEKPAAPEAPPVPTPTPEQDMTHIAGSDGSAAGAATEWLLRGIDGRSKNFAMRLQEEDLLDADNGILIGRSNRAHFIINDESVSRNHARLLLIGGQLMVEDLDAMNGVWVSGQRLQPRTPAALDVGTEFAIGKVNMRVDPVT